MPRAFKQVQAVLIQIFRSNPHWNATEIEFDEAANISVAIAILKVQDSKFIGDVGDIIRMHIDRDCMPQQLINLAKSSFYMREFQHSRDIYSVVHAKATRMYHKALLSEEIIQNLR